MRRLNVICLGICAAVAALALGGCASEARDTTGFAVEAERTVSAPKEEAWQAVKAVLREQDLQLYTRDKRGLFVAFREPKRHFLVQQRTQYSIELVEVSSNETQVFVEQLRQVYGVTLMTYPDWHDRRTKDDGSVQQILDAVEAKISGVPPAAPAAAEAATAPVEADAPGETAPPAEPVVEEAAGA